jgi:hypothetical protein
MSVGLILFVITLLIGRELNLDLFARLVTLERHPDLRAGDVLHQVSRTRAAPPACWKTRTPLPC